MHNEQQSPEQIIAELKIRFFDFREQAEQRMLQMENVLHTILGTAGVQSVDEVLELLKKEEEEAPEVIEEA